MRIELRKTPRSSARTSITYQPANGSEWRPATLLDVGPSGAALRLDQPHCLHEALHLAGLPANGGRCEGVVRWVRKDAEGYQVGVEFV